MWHDVEQNTPEWLQMRAGRITGSAISKIMANDGKAFGDPAKKLAVDLAVERLTGKHVSSGFQNIHMQRGHEQEPIARELYQDAFFVNVENGGFFDNEKTGCSPDGIIYDGDKLGLIEIKSVIPSQQYKRIKAGVHDPAYTWQIMHNLRESKAEYCDYISFCNDFPAGKKLFVERIFASGHKVNFDKIETRLKKFEKLIDEIMGDIKNVDGA